MIENHRAMIWRLMRNCSYIKQGSRRADFTGGWLALDEMSTKYGGRALTEVSDLLIKSHLMFKRKDNSYVSYSSAYVVL